MLILISDAFDKSLPEKLKVFGEVTEDASRLSEADVVLVRSKTKCTKEYIDEAKNLKLIIRGGVGMDNIDKAYCEEKGIIAVNTPKSSSIAVAELAFALMISVPNRIVYYDTTMKKGEWNKKTKRSELYGKTLALLGMGNIARKVAERARAFGMNLVSYDKYVDRSDLARMVDSAEEAVRDADYISMHLPLTAETEGIMNASLISVMTDALKSGKVSHFCTDVYSVEPMQGDSPLLECDNITLTPHVGANSVENLLRIGDEVIETIEKLKKEGKI